MQQNEDALLDSFEKNPNAPRETFLKGVGHAVIYYLIGFLLAAAAYLTFGYRYVHAPGMHHMIILFTFAGGFFWGMGAVYNHIVVARSPKLIGIILTHAVAVLAFVVFIIVVLYLAENRNDDDSPGKVSRLQKGDMIQSCSVRGREIVETPDFIAKNEIR
jgi:hypothetical protein